MDSPELDWAVTLIVSTRDAHTHHRNLWFDARTLKNRKYYTQLIHTRTEWMKGVSEQTLCLQFGLSFVSVQYTQ